MTAMEDCFEDLVLANALLPKLCGCVLESDAHHIYRNVGLSFPDRRIKKKN